MFDCGVERCITPALLKGWVGRVQRHIADEAGNLATV